METPGRPVAVGPVGGALRDPARRHPDPRLDPRLPPRARLGDDLRWGTRQPVRALGPDAVRPRRRGRHQDRLGDHHSDSRRSSHGLLQDRSLYQRSIGYARAPEGDARAEPVARRGDRLATRTDDRDPRPCAPSRELPARRRELVSRLAGHRRRRAGASAAGRLQPAHGCAPGRCQGGGPHVPLEALRAGQDADPRVPRRAPHRTARGPDAPPARPAWVSGRWSSFPPTTRPGTSRVSSLKYCRKTLVSRSWWWMTNHRTAPASSPTRWPRRSPASTCCTGKQSSAWERLTSPASSGLWNGAMTTCSRWTRTSRTIRRT